MPLTAADRITGLTAVNAIMAALLNRERTGKGQSLEVPMFEVIARRGFELPIGPAGYNRLMAQDRRPYQTADGYISALVYTNRH